MKRTDIVLGAPRQTVVRLIAFVGALASALAVAACGGSDSTTPQPGVALAKSSGDSQTVLAGGDATAQPIVVKVTSGGTPMPGEIVYWSAASAGGSLDPVTSTTDANGLARTTFLSPAIAAVDTVRATAARSPATGFVVTIVADTTTGTLSAFAGDGTATLVGHSVTLSAKATDLYGNARSGIVVTFTATSGILSNATVTTDNTGQATTLFTPGPGTGSYIVHATADRLQSVTFSVTAL